MPTYIVVQHFNGVLVRVYVLEVWRVLGIVLLSYRLLLFFEVFLEVLHIYEQRVFCAIRLFLVGVKPIANHFHQTDILDPRYAILISHFIRIGNFFVRKVL